MQEKINEIDQITTIPRWEGRLLKVLQPLVELLRNGQFLKYMETKESKKSLCNDQANTVQSVMVNYLQKTNSTMVISEILIRDARKADGKWCQPYLSDRGEKKPGVLSFEAMKRVRPFGIHFAILLLMNSGWVSLSRWGWRLLSTPNLSFLFFSKSPRLTWIASYSPRISFIWREHTSLVTEDWCITEHTQTIHFLLHGILCSAWPTIHNQKNQSLSLFYQISLAEQSLTTTIDSEVLSGQAGCS